MTKDYIEREAAIGKANKFAYIYHANRHEEIVEAFLMFIQELKFLPSADVTPIVRCKECDHWNAETHGCTRNPSLEPWWESDFCNYWEKVRKE